MRESGGVGGGGKTFWLKKDEVAGEWRQMQNEKRYDLPSSPNTKKWIKSG